MLQMILGLTLGAWLISVGVVGSSERRPCFIGRVNGCTVPFNMNVPFKKQFTVACDRHDVCYACGSDKKYKLKRRRCDDMFRSNMLKICKRKKGDCKEYAHLYYNIVRGFGWLFYNDKPSGWCTHSRVPGCIRGSV